MMPKATTCKLENAEISIEAALRLRDQAKHKCEPRPDFKCIDCNNDVNPFRESRYGSAHFEHLRRNADCPLSDPER